MKYFKECKSIEDVKSTYKRLAKDNHPDMGGETATMQEINTEYAYACARIYKGQGLNDDETDTAMKMSEAYREAIAQIIHLPGLIIEIVGNWIWVTGQTRDCRKELKEAKFFFASKKLAWYFRTDEYRMRGGKKDLSEIRAKYGSQLVSLNKHFINH